MTQIATVVNPSITQGPRGIGARNAGGAYSPDSQQDIIDCDPQQGAYTLLTGTTDVLNPQAGGNYLVQGTPAADLCTLAAPRAGLDDGVTILFHSVSAYAHKITCPTTLILNGAATAKTSATLPAFAGGMITLRAYNGNWLVLASNGTITYA